MPDILIIDDDAHVRNLFRTLFESAGYTVDDAADGELGLAKFRRAPARLVILDIVMPVKDGVETLIELRKDSPSLPIVAVSGGGAGNSSLYLEMADKLGATAAMAKPVDSKALLERVREILGGAADYTFQRDL